MTLKGKHHKKSGLKKLFDTPKEKQYWFSALARTCDVISVTTIVSGSPFIALITVLIGTLGREISGYFKLEEDEPENNETKENP